MAGGFVADLHPGCGLLNGDEAVAVDPLQHQAVAGGQAHGGPLIVVSST